MFQRKFLICTCTCTRARVVNTGANCHLVYAPINAFALKFHAIWSHFSPVSFQGEGTSDMGTINN